MIETELFMRKIVQTVYRSIDPRICYYVDLLAKLTWKFKTGDFMCLCFSDILTTVVAYILTIKMLQYLCMNHVEQRFFSI